MRTRTWGGGGGVRQKRTRADKRGRGGLEIAKFCGRPLWKPPIGIWSLIILAVFKVKVTPNFIPKLDSVIQPFNRL